MRKIAVNTSLILFQGDILWISQSYCITSVGVVQSAECCECLCVDRSVLMLSVLKYLIL